ncbi:carboxy terminal-processing peptidase [Chitinophaga polysaccharea]|uniref:carboxy terminal-processing peptidase n=1 Tax=Chitinophaga polysaccharea TaxID=1293035 RepID=UPI001454EDEE|nr:carboxy terminal-processing peptidase [Chitinophaga polysaccharea]NLR57575.1 carboxy terminal-processing peptidase [Chitinophaga polysaccharea]
MTMAKYWRFLPLLAVGLTAYANNTPEEDKEVNRKNVIRLVMKRINNEHYAPKAVDDQFSRIIWKKYLQALDANKNTLLQSDIDALRKYETLIDDELTNPSLEYFNAIYSVSMQRLRELQEVYRTILAQPMNFKVKETIQPDRSTATYPADEAARREVWRKSLKYQVLKKMLEIQQKDKNKTDAVAEKEARKSVLMSTDGLFKSLLSNTASDDRFSAYMNTITLEMDPHTNYMAPMDASLRESMLTHRYYGLGLELISKEGDIVIKRVMPGGTAARSGLLHVDDRILSLSDEKGAMIDITGMSIVDVSKMIRGENNSTLKLLVRKSTGTEKEVTVVRGEIKEDGNAAKSAVISDGARKIGYIQLPEFYLDQTRPDGAHCAVDVAKEVEKLKQQQVDGIIVDLRGNPGGSLDQVVAMTGLFVKTGPVVLEKDRTRIGSYPIQNGDKPLYEGPLAVMVDEGSASASEIFSAAIQDYRRGIIIGSPSSYGKGTMQITLPMGKVGDAAKGIPDISYGSLALTIKKFYRINGHTTQLNGVIPDVIFPSRRAYARIKERDNESALVADTIEKAYYMPYPGDAELKKVAAAAQDRINRDSAFNVVKRDVEWLRAHDTPVYSLEKNAFKQQLNEIQSYNDAIDKAVKLPADKQLTIKGTSIKDATPDNLAKYQEWMNNYTKDRYLAGTVDILADMIGK